MFCPKCATQNIDGASFCRSCGANVSLVSQALSGQLPTAPEPEEEQEEGCRTRRKRGRREPSLDAAIKNAFMGVAFLIVSMSLAFSSVGRGWWFWMLIPAFSMMATGVAQYIRLKERDKTAYLPRPLGQPAMPQQPISNAFPVRNTGELVPPPPSVTEGTTRHLGAEAPTRHLGGSGRN